MKATLVALFAIILACTFCLCQKPIANPSIGSFQWDSRQIQELGPENALSRSKAVSTQDRKTLIRLITAELQSDTDESEAPSRSNLRLTALATRIKTVDLSGGGRQELAAQAAGPYAGCSPTGNCPIWIFEKSGDSFKPILEARAIQTLTIQPTKTNGYRDIVLGMHGSAFEQELHLYQFHQGQYEEVACYDALWQRLVGDEWQQIDKPDIKPCGTE